MKASRITLASLALFFGAATAQSAYDSICSSPPVGEQDVDPDTEPGLVATYGCGQFHKEIDYAHSAPTAATPKDCALQCAERTPEGPCTWHEGTCYFYKAGAGIDPYTSSVTITVRKDWDKLRAAYKKCESNLDTCQKDKDSGGGPPTGGPPTGGPPIGGPPVGGPPDIQKNCKTGDTFNYAGRKWEMFCTGRWDSKSDIAEYKKHPSIQTMPQCFDKCVATTGCNGINWEDYSKTCTTNTLTDATLSGHTNNVRRLREVTK